MKLKECAITMVIALSLCISASAQSASTSTSLGTGTVQVTTQTAVYSMEMTNVAWYQKIALFILGLDWEEITITTISSYDPDTAIKKIISVHAWPSDSDENEAAFHLDSDLEKKSFMYFLKYTQFKKEEIPKLLDLFVFLYGADEGEMKFSAQNLFEKGDGSMHCELLKRKSDNKYITDIRTLNGSGAQNGKVEVTVSPEPEMVIEKIYAELKIGPKITLTLKELKTN